METLALYHAIRRQGGAVLLDGTTLEVRPRQAVGDLGPTIREQKPALIALLTTPADIPGEFRQFDAGAAYREHQANPPADDSAWLAEVPPALQERPGMDLRGDVWYTVDGFKVITPGTMPALRRAQRREFYGGAE